jgi:ankyrin repeat protein
MPSQQQIQQQIMMQARQQHMQMMAMQQRAANGNTPHQQMQPQSQTMGSKYDDLPINNPSDLEFLNGHPTFFAQPPAFLSTFASACRHGPLSLVQSTMSQEQLTPAFLHYGLTLALSAGNIEVADYLLSNGAPIVRETPGNVLSAPPDQQIGLFELLLRYGWTPNTPSHYGATLLPKTVTNLPLLTWFLDHGADPNLGAQRDNRDRRGGPDTNSCVTLEVAASNGDVQAVRMILEAGARIENGLPLHYAAGACPPGENPHAMRVESSFDVDTSRIPVMALLVEHGADVNQKEETRHMTPQYAIVNAVMAGAVERVRWLLEHGADPNARGAYGSAIERARAIGNQDMICTIEGFVDQS